jgi:hypothetical protein
MRYSLICFRSPDPTIPCRQVQELRSLEVMAMVVINPPSQIRTESYNLKVTMEAET